MTSGATKVCRRCAETIKPDARVCPFCGSAQGRFAGSAGEWLSALVALVWMAIIVVVCVRVFPEESDIPGRKFTRHRDELEVVQVSLEREQKKPEYWLAGYVTNKGDYPWRVHELEVRFLDPRGDLLDVRHPKVSYWFVVQPRNEHAFRVELGKLAFTNNEVIKQVRVQMATDGNERMEPD